MQTLMHPLAFQMKTDIGRAIRTVCLLLSVLLEVWKFLRSVGQIFDNNLLKSKKLSFISLGSPSEDEAYFVLCPASLVKVVCLYLK